MSALAGPVLTAAEMRAAEAACGVPLATLMERAGAALADSVWRFGGGQPVLILCGPGNNGGDGYVAARLLNKRGVVVRVAASGDSGADPARQARARWTGAVEALADAAPAPVLVDALFGTGLRRALAPDVANPLRRLASAARLVIAADVPSGVGSDDGSDLGAVAATVTLAFAAAKPAHLLQPAAALCGRVLVADLGIAADSRASVLGRPALSPPTPADHKYARGFVAVIGGAMAGAAALSATAAARAGAGYVVLYGDGPALLPNAIVRRSGDLENALGDARVGAILIGPGLGRDDAARARLEPVLASARPLVLDADALTLLGADAAKRLAGRAAPTILTPHAGEFARMFGAPTGSKLDLTRDAARASGCTIVFKGADTVIAAPDGRATLAPAASPWLATAGTGDVLAGIVAALLARGLDPHDAGSAAVWLHGAAARRAGPGLIADDLAAHLAACL